MNVLILLQSSIFVFCCLAAAVVKAENNNDTMHCYRVDLQPHDVRISTSADAYEPTFEFRKELKFHLFDGGTGNVLVSSNASTSNICLNDNDDYCYYWFIHGGGSFTIVRNETEEVMEAGWIPSFDQPKMLQMGNCRSSSNRHCGHDHHQQQITFIGLTEDEPILYDSASNVHTLVQESHLDNDDGGNSITKEHENEAVMKTACILSNDCYQLVGSSLYVIITSTNNTLVVEEEGSTFHGSKTIGDDSKCRSHCDTKPRLADTLRGREILQVASSVSSSNALRDVEAPQYQAACWIAYDDRRQLSANDRYILQRYILAVMFFASGGENWNRGYDFLTPKHECHWIKWAFRQGYANGAGDDYGDGIRCNGLGYVSGIFLGTNNLVGTIPFEVSLLVHVQYIELVSNSLYGPIPSAIGNMLGLRVLSLSENYLTGPIPESLGQVETLSVMSLNFNLLTGTIPSISQRDYFKNIARFRCFENMISGSIPHDVGKWTNLVQLGWGHNYLSGTIPEDISNLKNLQIVTLHRNDLIGTLPSKILKLPKLEELSVSANSLTGTIPSDIAMDGPLDSLSLGFNQLSGSIPSVLSLLQNLQTFTVNDNALTGEIPSNFTHLQNLDRFFIHNNNLTGVAPFQDCEQSPYFMEADCDTPQKVHCPCCTACYGIFTYRGHDDDNLVCSSGELTLLLEDLDAAVWGVELQNFANEDYERIFLEFFFAVNTTFSRTSCVPMTGCFKIMVAGFSSKPFKLTVMVNNDVVLEEYTEQSSDEFLLGFHSDGMISKDSCEKFVLCDTSIEVNSTDRELVNMLTRVTGIQVFDDSSSSYYNAACDWISYLEHREDSSKGTDILQGFYLALFFYETNGGEWTRSDMWGTTTASFCDWYGIECNNYGLVTSIRLPSNNLRGIVPTEIGELRGLEYISLGNNSLSGTLPVEFGVKLTLLKEFNLSKNALWGGIAPEYSNLVELEIFDASHNQLTGSLPEDIGNWEKIHAFHIFNNTCTGSLPTKFYDLLTLKHLSLGSNLFAGSASRIEELSNLESLDLSQNFFTGNIPVGLSQKKLRLLDVSGNQFRGSIPSVIDRLESLETMFLYNNILTGNLPSETGNLVNLVQISLSDNSIKGGIPTAISGLKNLTLFHLQKNLLTGSADIFDYTIEDYISDCGNTFTGPARIECITCSSCCNVNGDCISTEITWPGGKIPLTRVTPQGLVFATILAGCILFVMFLMAYRSVHHATSDFLLCHEFEVQSVYKFFLTNNIGANAFAAATLTIQLILLSIFLEASNFTAARNDWEYSMSCPDNSITCEENRFVSPLAWVGYCCIMFCYLANDFVESIKMVHQCVLLKSRRKGTFAGFVVLYVTSCSAVVSALYNYSTAISNTDILKDAVILLFLNELDEKLYLFLEKARPDWIEKRNSDIKAHFEKLRERHAKELSGSLSSSDFYSRKSSIESSSQFFSQGIFRGFFSRPNNARLANTPLRHDGKVQSRKRSNLNRESNLEAIGHGLKVAEHERIRERGNEILILNINMLDLENAQKKLRNNNIETEKYLAETEQEVFQVKCQFEQEIHDLKQIICAL